MMFTSSQWRIVKPLERDVGCKFELTSPPAVEEVLEPSTEQVAATLNGVYPEYVEFFTPAAQKPILKKKKKKKKKEGSTHGFQNYTKYKNFMTLILKR